jgi:hypothetical protein
MHVDPKLVTVQHIANVLLTSHQHSQLRLTFQVKLVCQLIHKKNEDMWESRGGYTIHFCKTNNRGVGIGEDKVFWHDSKREKKQLKISDLFIFAIRRYSHVNEFTEEFKVTRYTTFKVYDNASDNSVKYYANEYMNGQKRRYDYAMIEFVLDDRTIAICPAMILWFVQYNITLGIPTHQFTGKKLSLNTMQEKKTWLLTTTYMWLFIQHQIMCQVNDWKQDLCHRLFLEML